MLLRQTTGGELKFNPTTLRGSLIEAIEILKQYLPVGFVPDGRMIINGGEYNSCSAVWTNKGALYDPVGNTWTSVTGPSGWSTTC